MIRSRSWRWFRIRLEGLLSRPVSVTAAGTAAYSSRVQEIVVGPQYQEPEGA